MSDRSTHAVTPVKFDGLDGGDHDEIAGENLPFGSVLYCGSTASRDVSMYCSGVNAISTGLSPIGTIATSCGVHVNPCMRYDANEASRA
jgi:hypothetical protein